MATNKINLVQGDNLPFIELSLKNSDNSPLDVSNATVNVLFKSKGSTSILSTILCTNVTDGSDGRVVFNFPGTTLDVAQGYYEGEVKIDFGWNSN